MSDDDNVEKVSVDDPIDEIEEAFKDIQNVKQKFNLIRSQHILSEAVYVGDSPDNPTSSSDTESVRSDLEDCIDRLCIQESALQSALESDTIKRIRVSGVLNSELQELLALQLRQETQIISLASEISEEYSNLQEAKDNLSDVLKKYVNYEKKRGQQLKENGVPEDDQRLKRQLKEIRFMQRIIPNIVSLVDDYANTGWVVELCKEVRNAVLSVDDV